MTDDEMDALAIAFFVVVFGIIIGLAFVSEY